MTHVLITGAASGIGLALSTVCLQKGHTVIMVDNNEIKLLSEIERLNSQFSGAILAHVCDITQPDAVQQLASTLYNKLSYINWIFNNAGIIGNVAPIWQQNLEQIKKVIDVNVFGMIHMIQSFMPLLLQQQSPAHIINMASLYAICSGSQLAPYSMSKHAVLALSESLYFDLQRLQKNIAVSVVLPSFTDTALLSHSAPSEASAFHQSLNNVLAHSRPALDVASQIIDEVEQKRFYIFPDKEVKSYSEERIKAMLAQDNPHVNNIEQLMCSLFKRSQKNNKN